MKIFIAFLFSFLSVSISFAQWSTSTNVDSALYVCPGFEPGILTLEDGSSYIAGGLNDYLFVQKLDPEGYKLWQQPVQVFHAAGADNLGFFTMVHDGLGGLIFIWKDFRGGYVGPDDYYNNALYMQRVDQDGNTIWKENGIQLAPVEGGIKDATVTNDGNGGAIIMLGESDFKRPGALKKARTWIQHYDKNGIKQWSYTIDSSDNAYDIYPPQPVIRLGSITRFHTKDDVGFINNSGTFIDTLEYKPRKSISVFPDSGAFEIKDFGEETDSAGNRVFIKRITRISNQWDSVWSTDFRISDEGENVVYGAYKAACDYDGGLFYSWSFLDYSNQKRVRIQHITSQGAQWTGYGLDILDKSSYSIFSAKNEVGVFFGDATVQKFNKNMEPLWKTPTLVFSNSPDAYFKVFASDNNGGCITAFWTTAGGIFAQHTGRNGELGIITGIERDFDIIPDNFELSQNYPNPFNPSTTFEVEIPQQASVIIKIYDILGEEIKELLNTELNIGKYTLKWDGQTSRGIPASSGIYFCTMEINNQKLVTRKLILTK